MSLATSAVPLSSVVLLATAMAGKHFLADFVLQTGWMVRRKERRAGWIAPLAAHALCHAGLTLIIALLVAPVLWWLAVIDLLVHFSVDRAKATVAGRCGWTPDQARYWWLFGFDQMLHQLTDIVVIAILLAH